MAFMSLNGIDVSYDKKKQILKGLNLEVEEGELVSLLGPSGCGKSTTLRVVAGFIDPQGGTFTLDGEDMTKVPVHKRQFGLVFQSYALFPHLSVYDNVAFGLRTRKMDKDVIDKKVKEILEVCGLTELADRFPKQMSGGQRQRVALARALVIEPKLLLLDEPLSNLDAKLRLSMRVEIKRLQKRLGITTLFVTHDQEECFSISDKVAVMNGGVIEQFDTPENIYKRPATEFVARFIGFENFLELAKKQDGVYTAPDGSEFLTSMDLDCENFAGTIRPDDICLADEIQTENVLSGTIGVRTFLGKSYQYEVETSAGVLKVNMGTDHVYKEGEKIRLYLPKDKLILVPRIYTNKPRTTGEGYKGITSQPDPEKKPDFLAGLMAMRKMHIRAIKETGLTAADEMLYPENWGYVSDILSYVAIGARSVEDQQHRLTVSGFDVASGMKNPTSGDFSVMLNSVYAAQHPHHFVYRGYEVETSGNPLTHVVLRGAVSKHGNTTTNYHYEDLIRLHEMYDKMDVVNQAAIIDTNHSNSGKKFKEQIRIAKEVMHNRQLSFDIKSLVKGLMIESYIEEGSQKIGEHVYGKSITDPCLGWEDSKKLIYDIAEMNS